MKSSHICHERLTCRQVIRLLGIALIAASATRDARAIDPNRTMSQYVRERWGVEHGFPRGPVYSIDQSKDGYLWIGTEKGLVRFDGLSFHVIQSAAPQQPSLSHILGLVADKDGSLWTRLRRPGLTLLRYHDGSFQNVMGDLATRSSVSAMTRGRDGTALVWVLGQARAVVLRGKNLENVATLDDFPRAALTMAETASGEIWVGTQDAGLFRLAGGRTSSITEGLPDLKVNALVATGSNEVWVATDGGIVRWDGTKLTKAGVPRSLDGVQALAMAVDRDSNLWVGTNSQGLLRVNSQGVASLNEGDGLSREAVTAVFEDREGNMWVGSGTGLMRLRDSTFVTYSFPEGLPTDGSNPIFVDSENRAWFSPVGGGLRWMKDGQDGQLHVAGIDKEVIYSIAGRKAELWLGRQRGGLTQLRSEGGGFVAKTYTQADGLAQNSVYSVYLSRDGAVWAGTLSGGVSKFAGGRFTNYNIENGLTSNTVNSILEGSDGTMWFGTPGGLSALTKSGWRSYNDENGLPSKDVNCLFEDSTGVLWAGTGAGIAFQSAGRFQVSAGLPASLTEQILGITEDAYGSLWMATSNHVLRVNRDRLKRGAFIDGDLREYSPADGLRGIEGVKRFRSVLTDPLGRIWFSLNRGISVLDPARLRNNSAPAIVHVQAVSADGNPIGLQGAVHIPGGRKRITFTYAGLSLSVPERVRFRYKLDGFDAGWSEPVSTRETIYTNLAPRSYRFRVMASNPDGVWGSLEDAITFEVDPLFWQTWWFRLSIVAGCWIAILALYRLRLYQHTRRLNVRFEERLAERTRIAQELHDTLLQGFISASMQVHVATDGLPRDSQAKPTLTRALELMGQVIEEGRNAVRGLRSSNSISLDLEHAFSRIQQEAVLGPGKGEPVAFRVIVNGQARPLRPLLRDEVYRIGREALLNAFRHAQAKNIELELMYSANHLRILVRDDGRGIDPEVLKSGLDGHWGLLGMRERADRIGAGLHVWSNTTGTEINLSVPAHIAFQDHRNHKWRWFRTRAGSHEAKTKNGANE